jgi:arabinose-5-phosphate isomerase
MPNSENELDEAKTVLRKEATAIQRTANRLKLDTFCKAIDILFETKGKIVITGIGKSGHVGKKMAAMLCSTGSPTVYLHPSEAVHGDLGIHQKGDPVIYLSNSGSTPELIYLEPVFRARGAKILGLLGQTNSPLAEKVDVLLDASVSEEADPLGIVPTSSFIAASALGDAIGAALMKRRNFDKNEYAKTHPAGQLGRNLILQVKDVFQKKDKIAIISKETRIKEVVIEMSKYPLGAACVLEKEKLIGIVTDGDLRRALQNTEDLANKKVSQIMTEKPLTISPQKNLGEALEVMEKRNPSPISILPVVNSEDLKLLGLIRLHDILGV